MDYIKSKLERKIRFIEANNDEANLKIYYQVRIEYSLIFLLGYLWNKNLDGVELDTKENIYQNIGRPSIGTIVSICRSLDIDKEVFKNRKVSEAIDKYPVLRNEKIGHGYVFESGAKEFLQAMKELYDAINSLSSPLFNQNVDFVKVTKQEGNLFKGISFKSNGSDFDLWFCPKEVATFEIGSLYVCINSNQYFRISPFIEIDNEDEIFVFASIDEKLLGKVKYNKILQNGKKYKEWEELCELDIENDGLRRKSQNGTILNVYENNYKKYFDTGVKKKIEHFLLKNRASVCATVWGHGGVGKTATVQSLCEDLSNSDRKIFDYIIFLTAKDRYYNYYRGEIHELNERVDTLENIIKSINLIMFNQATNSRESITNYQGRLLLVVDDFETFSQDEREAIADFIKELNVNNHKVVVTTRIVNINIGGEEITTSELSKEETQNFLLQVIASHLEGVNTDLIKNDLASNDNLDRVFEITSGRPLFIFQFAFLLGQKGSVARALESNIKGSSSAVDFLYGRIYDTYLSNTAKDLFVGISLLVSNDNLSAVIDKLKYVLNMENDEDKFYSALKDLVKLKIIKVDDENKIFEVYSKEILQIMTNHYRQRNDVFKGVCNSRLQQINNRGLDTEHALLLNANASRLSKNEEETISNYKQILNRNSSPEDVKLNAILNLAAYLVDRGKKDIALKQLDEYRVLFPNNLAFSKMHATYYWANGTNEQKRKAIDILRSYTSTGFRFDNDVNLEIAGILLTYRSLLLNTEWEELKESSKFGDITYNEFKQKRERQRQVCKEILLQQGQPLYNYIINLKLNEITYAGAKQNVVAGLYQFVEICIKLENWELAKNICDYIFYFAPKHFHAQFQIKLSKINWINHKNNPKTKIKNLKKETPLELAFKEALNKKKK